MKRAQYPLADLPRSIAEVRMWAFQQTDDKASMHERTAEADELISWLAGVQKDSE